MATFVRNRVLQQLSWEDESEESRARRRNALCELDGVLTHLEEINLRGGDIPARILVKLRRQGVLCRPGVTSAELIEAIFAVQERYMRQPEGTVQGDLIGVNVYQRRAS
jgi:hypothetical protein